MDRRGFVVRRLRVKRGKKIEDLAKALGVSISVMSKKERGEVPFKQAQWEKAAKFLGVSLTELDALVEAADPGIPIVSIARAGAPTDYAEMGVEPEDVMGYLGRAPLRDPQAKAVIVEGDSMSPTLEDGDFLIVVPMDRGILSSYNGRIVALSFSQECSTPGQTIGRWRLVRPDWVEVHKDNPAARMVSCAVAHLESSAVAIERRTQKLDRR